MKYRKIVTVTVTSVVVASAIGLAAGRPSPGVTEELPPFITQIEDHEVRIDGLEVKVDETEAKVDQTVQSVRVVETRVEQIQVPAPPPPNEPGAPQAAPPIPEPAPAAETEPTPHPWTIIAVSDEVDPYTANSHTCTYKLYDSRQSSIKGSVTQPLSMPCQQVGEVML